MPKDTAPLSQLQDIGSHQISLTVFPDNLARRKTEHSLTLPALAAMILATKAERKDRLPLLKLASFGNTASAKKCLRTDANMGEISGVEVEHDAGEISFKRAMAILRKAGLRCLGYTTPSHVPITRERWRILLPTSRALPKGERRRRLVGLVNGLFGGALARESFVGSQAFYFGSVGEAVCHVQVLDGVFVDLAGLVKEIGPTPLTSAGNGGDAVRVTAPRTSHDLTELRKEAKKYHDFKYRWDSGTWHNFMLSYTASLAARRFTEAEIRAECGPCCDLGEDDPELTPFIESGLREFGPKSAPIALAALVTPTGSPSPPIRWDRTGKSGAIAASMPNAVRGMEGMGLRFSHDTFHNKMWIEGPDKTADYVGEMDDRCLRALRLALYNAFGVDFGEKPVREAAVTLAEKFRYDPVADMLAEAEAEWDGVERIDRMAVDYFNAEDTALNRAFVRLLMIAAVRRVRQPGCKFDQILVMESREGWNKSSAWRVLAGEENFSDESIMGHETRFVQEHLADIWILECAELAGITRREVEMVTTFASRQVDRARPAYGHFLVAQPRHSVLVGTTNAESWLPKQTGNRRFWPLTVLAPIDLKKLKRDRLQLWGEAAALETARESIELDEALRDDAGAEQELRRIVDPWEDILCDLKPITEATFGTAGVFGTAIVHEMDGFNFVASADIFAKALPRVSLDANAQRRLATVMRQLGWERYQLRLGEGKPRGYRKIVKNRNKPGIVSHSLTSRHT